MTNLQAIGYQLITSHRILSLDPHLHHLAIPIEECSKFITGTSKGFPVLAVEVNIKINHWYDTINSCAIQHMFSILP